MAPDRVYGARAPLVKTKERGTRTDALRNRQRVLEVADRVFAAEGMGVPTDEIARRSGVGPGTVYRHFPTKEGLFMAVAVKRVTESIQEARRLAEMDDPTAALFEYLRSLGAQFQARKNLIEVMAAGGQSLHDAHPELAKELNEAIGILLSRAQATGSVRTDVGVGDVMNLVVGVYSATTQTNRRPEDSSRLLAIVFDGLRAAGSSQAGRRHRAATKPTGKGR